MEDRAVAVVIGLILGLAAGVAVNIPIVMITVFSAGAGHGSHAFAKLFFPYSMLLSRFLGDGTDLAHLVLALAQFPLYGAAIGASFSWKRLCLGIVGGLTVLHGLAALGCVVGSA